MNKFKLKAWILAFILGWAGYHCLYIKRYLLCLMLSLNLFLAYYSMVTINAMDIFILYMFSYISLYVLACYDELVDRLQDE